MSWLQSAPAPAFAAAQNTGYPRLGALCPDVSTSQSIAEAARFDYVVLLASQRGAIASLKSINPDLIVLNGYTAACEIAPDSIASNALPTSWILTQVGTTLSSGIDASTQTIPVAALTNGSLQLFAVGQYVVVGNEVCLVTAVNTAASTLSVTRGVVYPAAAHPAGERVAACACDYPGTVRMDMTDRCPAVDLGDGHGPQTWMQWRVRDTLARVADPVWDGVYVDLCGSNQSHIVGPSNPTRSIDYLRNNTPPADGYAAFDAAWNAGQAAFDGGVRAGLGTRIYFTNEFASDYPVRNGTIFEHFPYMRNVGYAWEWQTTMFGPRDPGKGDRIGSVTDWMSECATPNLTTLLEYETTAGIVEYQKMRYGLCSSLIAGAHFSYASPGSGSTVFPWMDEYDNAGAGTGYLGQPTADAYPVPGPGTTDVLGGNGAFDTSGQFGQWKLYTNPGANYGATAVRDTGVKFSGTSSLKVVVPASTAQTDVKLKYGQSTGTLSLTAGQPYTVTVTAKATAPMNLSMRTEGATWDDFPGWKHVTTDWQTFSFSMAPTCNPSVFTLVLGDTAGTIWIDSVTLTTGGREVRRRDFQGGCALVNASDKVVTVGLGGTYRKIKGTQAPLVNDGSLVTAVTLPPRDGLVLVRTTALSTSTFRRISGTDRVGTAIAVSQAGWPTGAVTVALPVFGQEFSTGPLDSTVWGTTTPWDTYDNPLAGEFEWYDPTNLSFVNGGLRITTEKRPAHPPYAYASGIITTGSHGASRRTFSYGYFEMRAKLPKGKGIWPAFWLTNDHSFEIDAFELLGDHPTTVYMTLHDYLNRLNPNSTQVYQATFTGPDFSAGYHTFGVDWQPSYVHFYIDGILRGSYSGAIPSDPLWILANTAVGGWAGAPDTTTVLPQYYDIDYIRVYKTVADAAPADTVVVATSENYPDALAAAPLAKAYGGPVLLTPAASLTTSLTAELKRLAPKRVLIVGGSSVVSANVASQLAALPSGPTIMRYGGVDRYDTAARIADAVKAKLGSVTGVVVVTGADYHDGLIAAPLAAAKGWPVLLTQGTSLPSYTSAALGTLNPASTLVVGDTTDVSADVYSLLPGTRTRLGYTDHYDQCAAVVGYAKTAGVTVTHVALAVGNNFPDGLSAGPYLARDSGLLLLTDTGALPSAITQCLTANKATITTLDAIGGTSVVSDAVMNQAVAALK